MAAWSPDGHWLAYDSTETGVEEVYVQPFPGPGEKVAISTGGEPPTLTLRATQAGVILGTASYMAILAKPEESTLIPDCAWPTASKHRNTAAGSP